MSIPVMLFIDKGQFVNYLCEFIIPKKVNQQVQPKAIQDVKLVLDIDTKHGLTMGVFELSPKDEPPYYVFVHYTSNFDGIIGQTALLKFIVPAKKNPEEYDTLIHLFETILGFKMYGYCHYTD